jgi:hypothetical protein
MGDHLNGMYCRREMVSKKDKERYKSSKIFKSMYQKAYHEKGRNDSRNLGKKHQHQTEVVDYEYDIPNTSGKKQGANSGGAGKSVMDLLYRNGVGFNEVDRDTTVYPKNDYAPQFVTSLNFNFNSNDIFGTTRKSPNPSLLKSNLNLSSSFFSLATLGNKSLGETL